MNGKRLFFILALAFLISLGIAVYDRYHNYDVDVQALSGVPLKAKTENTVAFQLTSKRDDKPLSPARLDESHHEKIEAVVVDPLLEDFHLVYPNVDPAIPGTYWFAFNPSEKCDYTAWIDVTPHDDKTEFIPLKLRGQESCGALPRHKASMTEYQGDAVLSLSVEGGFENKIWAHQPVKLHLSAKDKNGELIANTRFPDRGLVAVGIHANHPDEFEFAISPHDDKGIADSSTLYFTPERPGMVRFLVRVIVDENPINAVFTLAVH